MFTSHMSPLSTRELALADSTALCDVILPRALTHFRVDRIITGHTPQPNFSAAVAGAACTLTQFHSIHRTINGTIPLQNPPICVITNAQIRVILSDVATSRWMRG
jgi:hypothetical protein